MENLVQVIKSMSKHQTELTEYLYKKELLRIQIEKIPFPTGGYVYVLHIWEAPDKRSYGLYLYPERTILSIYTVTHEFVKEYGGEPIDTMAIVQTVRMPKEVRKCFLDTLVKTDWR